MRQSARSELIVRTLAAGYSAGTVLQSHAHPWAQVAYASEGVMTVQTADGTWVVPSHRAVWIPGGVDHSIAMSGWVSMRTLYIAPRLVAGLPRRCSVIAVPALFRQLILHTIALGALRRDVAEQRRLAVFLVDQLRVVRAVPLELPMPRDERALRAARRLRDAPGAPDDVMALARGAGASRRTLERLFQNETGMSLGRWRQQARLLEAMRRLAAGASVTATAVEVGYESTSAFIAAFSAALGTTPGRYYRSDGEPTGRRSRHDA